MPPPLVDPFSASSKPMPMIDSLPRLPLQFAATFHPIDPNTSLPTRAPPRPRLQRDPLPPAPHIPMYHQSFSPKAPSTRDLRNLKLEEARVGSDAWISKCIAGCMDKSSPVLEFTGIGLETLSTRIVEMRDIVTIKLAYFGPRSPVTTLSKDHQAAQQSIGHGRPAGFGRPELRISSAPAAMGMRNPRAPQTPQRTGVVRFDGLPTPAEEEGEDAAIPPQRFARQSPISRSVTTMSSGSSQPNAEIFAGQNRLTRLPSAMFEVGNISVLSLRGNRLQALPAAIGSLINLKDLNVANNCITELPHTVLSLERLELFYAHPNPFLEKDSASSMSPLVRHCEAPVRSLRDMCLSLLITPRKPHDLPPLLDRYDWEEFGHGEPHPLLDPAALHAIIPCISEPTHKRILQLLRSFSNQFHYANGHQRSWDLDRIDPFPRGGDAPDDDASTNPYYDFCPSPRHLESDLVPTRHLFLHPAEERVEWRDFAGQKNLPIRWKGCSPGCLAFLEQGCEEIEDGFDAAVIGDGDVVF
ncbi:hypothetical protein B9479_006310 [Cryptococcus floricola]|uniref:Uncharacterized protein n=1 Tax=Cryptococcus floricola TaxID=2591691 RepID=A0A5D3AQZ6_9TREE|nr:hypothetical protein B9479_006310 [Cryptococcus floricola]